MTSRERQYLLDILLAAEDALSFVGSATYEEFAADRLKRAAVLHCLMVIGEAAARVERLAVSDVPDLPWRAMRSLRNVIVHEYEEINLPRVWQIVSADLPPLVAKLSALFPERTP